MRPLFQPIIDLFRKTVFFYDPRIRKTSRGYEIDIYRKKPGKEPELAAVCHEDDIKNLIRVTNWEIGVLELLESIR